MKKFYILTAFLAILAIAGLGWYAATREGDGSGIGTVPASLAYLPPKTEATESQIYLGELRDVLSNFASAKSFRSTIMLSIDNQRTSGEIEIAKPGRFRGRVNVSGEELEVIGVEDVLYILSPEGVWVPLRSEQITGQLQETFAAALQGEDSDSSAVLSDDVNVTKQNNAANNCDEYLAAFRDENGNDVELTLCAQNGYPVTIELKRAEGFVQSEYSDFNDIIIIERPSIPNEFRVFVE